MATVAVDINYISKSLEKRNASFDKETTRKVLEAVFNQNTYFHMSDRRFGGDKGDVDAGCKVLEPHYYTIKSDRYKDEVRMTVTTLLKEALKVMDQ